MGSLLPIFTHFRLTNLQVDLVRKSTALKVLMLCKCWAVKTGVLVSKYFSINTIAFYIDCSWNIFSWHKFRLMLIEQVIESINLRKVRTENLKLRTDLQEWVLDGRPSLTHQHSKWLFWVADCSKILNLKIEARPVNAGLYIAFKYLYSFAVIFGCKLWLSSLRSSGSAQASKSSRISSFGV